MRVLLPCGLRHQHLSICSRVHVLSPLKLRAPAGGCDGCWEARQQLGGKELRSRHQAGAVLRRVPQGGVVGEALVAKLRFFWRRRGAAFAPGQPKTFQLAFCGKAPGAAGPRCISLRTAFSVRKRTVAPRNFFASRCGSSSEGVPATWEYSSTLCACCIKAECQLASIRGRFELRNLALMSSTQCDVSVLL
jgi:hypothetical protein